MSVKEFLEKRIGKQMTIVSVGLPKENARSGKLARVELDVAVIEDRQKKEWAIPLDKVLLIGPPDADDGERSAGFAR